MMRREFYDVYRDLMEIYRLTQAETEWRGPFPPPRMYPPLHALRIVNQALEETVGELQLTRRLRPDARHFLLVNLHQMIALPLEHPRGGGDGPPIEYELRDDLRTILEAARDATEHEEITGHDVIDTLSRVWGKLRTTGRNIWG